MPITPTYPGVYIEEIPSGVHTITGVSTSIAAFVGFFREGPMNEAVQITSLAEFNRIFGGLDNRSEASYAINQFFLNGGNQAYVVRVAQVEASGTGGNLAKASVSIADNTGDILQVLAKSEGAWGNALRVGVDGDTDNPLERFNLSVTRYSSNEGTAAPVASESFLNLSMDESDARYAVKIVNNESMLVDLEYLGEENTGAPGFNGLISGDLNEFTFLEAESQIVITMGGETKTVTLSDNNITSLTDLRDKLQVAIRNASASSVFTEARVDLKRIIIVAEDPGGTDTIEDRLSIRAGRKGNSYSPVSLITVEDAVAGEVATALLLTPETCYSNNMQEYALGWPLEPGDLPIGHLTGIEAGGDGALPGATEIIGQNTMEPFSGMYSLEGADLFNILCIPRAADLENDGDNNAVISRGLSYCNTRRAMMIIDIPSATNTISAMKAWMEENGGYRDKNAVLYFPRLQIPDPLDEYRLRNVAASGTMAGIFSRIDGSRGVWKAPAGTEAKLQGVSSLAIQREMTDSQNGILNPLGINCLRTFPLNGIISWGARTLVGADAMASEWKYIPIRRLALFIEESLFRGTKWIVFEPNDEPLWAKIRLNIGAFMMRLFRQGAFQGSTPDKAFFVKCDAETTPQSDRNLGIVNIEVGFAPLKPAEFVIIRIQQMAGEL